MCQKLQLTRLFGPSVDYWLKQLNHQFSKNATLVLGPIDRAKHGPICVLRYSGYKEIREINWLVIYHAMSL